MMKTATPLSTPTPTVTNPKSLVMLDATGKVATLKLTTSTGLHVYDGSMLWVNPAQSVTAAAPRTGQSSTTQPVAPKGTKALAIVDPVSGDELVIKKPEVPKSPPLEAAAIQPPPAATPLAAPASLAAPTTTPSATAATPSSSSKKEQNILDLLAKATKTTPSALLALSQPLMSNTLPPVQARGRGRGKEREYDRERDREQEKSKGRQGGKGVVRASPADGKGKGKGAREAAATKVEVGRYTGDKYTKDAKYTASLDGRFWTLACWPTGERDNNHRLAFGKHKLEVLENGVVKVVLFGGVNRYRVRLHLATENDDLGSLDKEGWSVASCEPSAANLQLSEDAEELGWKVYKGGEHPVLYPPGLPLPDPESEGGAGDPKSETETKTEVNTEAKTEVKTEAKTDAAPVEAAL